METVALPGNRVFALAWYQQAIYVGGKQLTQNLKQPSFLLLQQNPLAPPEWAESDEAWQPNECPGQSFQAWLLLENLKLSLEESNDILLEPYLRSWDQLLKYELSQAKLRSC